MKRTIPLSKWHQSDDGPRWAAIRFWTKYDHMDLEHPFRDPPLSMDPDDPKVRV